MKKEELLADKENMLYEDDKIAAVLVKEPAARGHMKVIPKANINNIDELREDESEMLFNLANTCAVLLFEGVGAQGTNIILNEKPLIIDIIARGENDGLNFMWNPKQIPTGELDGIKSSISGKILIPEKEPKPELKPEPREEINEEGPHDPPRMDDQPEDKKAEEENYMIKQLERIP